MPEIRSTISPPVPGMTVMPEYLDLPGMAGFWLGCVRHVLGDAEARAAFKADTGHDLDRLVAGSALDRLIDEASGHTRAAILAFLDWVTANYWNGEGEPDA